jgi:hypothetical protein
VSAITEIWITFRLIHWLVVLTTEWEGYSDVLRSVESMSNEDYFLSLWISANHSLWPCYSPVEHLVRDSVYARLCGILSNNERGSMRSSTRYSQKLVLIRR